MSDHIPEVEGYCDAGPVVLGCSCGWREDESPLIWSEHLPDSLDAAWAEAEAALPEGWWMTIHSAHPPVCIAYAGHHPSADIEIATHATKTPAAALRALAAKLRERAG